MHKMIAALPDEDPDPEFTAGLQVGELPSAFSSAQRVRNFV
jgi:hypothetical protein